MAIPLTNAIYPFASNSAPTCGTTTGSTVDCCAGYCDSTPSMPTYGCVICPSAAPSVAPSVAPAQSSVTKCIPVSAVSPRAPNFVKACAYVDYPLDAAALFKTVADSEASNLAQCQRDVDTYNALSQAEKDKIKADADAYSRYLCPLNSKVYVAPTKSDCSRSSLDNIVKLLYQNVKDGGGSCSQDSDCLDLATTPCYSLCTQCFDVDTCNKDVVSGYYAAKSETNCLRCKSRDSATAGDGMDCLGFPFAPSTSATPSGAPGTGGAVNAAVAPAGKKSNSSSSLIIIVVAVAGGVVVLLSVIAGVVIYKIKRRKNAVGVGRHPHIPPHLYPQHLHPQHLHPQHLHPHLAAGTVDPYGSGGQSMTPSGNPAAAPPPPLSALK